MERTITDTLLELPLFQGMSRTDIVRHFDYTRLKLTSLSAGRFISRQDSLCDGLSFLVEGSVVMETQAADRTWYVEEELAAPLVEGLEVLYGSTRTYRHSLRTAEPSQIFSMSKQHVASLIDNNEVFRLNVLNHLTTTIARRHQLTWLPAAETLESRMVQFFRSHVSHPAGAKTFHLTMQAFGDYLDTDARNISRALHTMKEQGLVEMMRNNIHIPHMELLMQHYA